MTTKTTKRASSFWKWYWLIWAIVMAVSFGVAEGIAIFNDEEGDTLTEVSVSELWSVIGPELTVLALAGFSAWLIYHFARRAAKKNAS